jgi:hypothetical protein
VFSYYQNVKSLHKYILWCLYICMHKAGQNAPEWCTSGLRWHICITTTEQCYSGLKLHSTTPELCYSGLKCNRITPELCYGVLKWHRITPGLCYIMLTWHRTTSELCYCRPKWHRTTPSTVVYGVQGAYICRTTLELSCTRLT